MLARTAYQDAFFAWPRGERERYVSLLRVADPSWAPGFLHWLRLATPMRYPALAGAAAFVAGRLARGEHGLSRQVIASVLHRADDPGHLLAYWAAVHGPSLPKPVKRGVADAVTRMYDEQALLAYDDGAHHFELGFVRADLPRHGGIATPRPLRFGEVIRLVHPVARNRAQGDLFRHALARRHGKVRAIPETLALVRTWAGLPAEEGAAEPDPPSSGGAGGRGAGLPPVAEIGGAVLAGPGQSAVGRGGVVAEPGVPVAEVDGVVSTGLGQSAVGRGGVVAEPGAPAGEVGGAVPAVPRRGVDVALPRWPQGRGEVVPEPGAPVAEVGGAVPTEPEQPVGGGGVAAEPVAEVAAQHGPLRVVAGLRAGAARPPGQWLAQLRRAGTRTDRETLLAALSLPDLLARPDGLARLEPLIPHLPLSALLAHLRRLDAAGIGFETAMAVAARMADPAEVRASGLGPLRFAAAWGGVDSRRWEPALAAGARHSLGAVPRLRGRTLVVVEPGCDTRIVFGLALAQRCEDADVVRLGGGRFPLEPAESPLHALIRWHSTDLRTATPVAAGHDRVVLVTEQYSEEPDVPAGVPSYVWETRRHSRYEHEPEFAPGSRRGFFRGLGDASFSIIPWWEEFVAGDERGG